MGETSGPKQAKPRRGAGALVIRLIRVEPLLLVQLPVLLLVLLVLRLVQHQMLLLLGAGQRHPQTIDCKHQLVKAGQVVLDIHPVQKLHVINTPTLGIHQSLICLLDILKAAMSHTAVVAAEPVWVPLLCQAYVRCSDLTLGSLQRHAQSLVQSLGILCEICH